MRRLLSIDGGGIRGVFPAAFLSTIETATGVRIADYFDLIVGTSTGGIIALGLGLGFSANDILDFYEHYGPRIFPKRRLGPLRQFFASKYNARPLREALMGRFGERRLGESQTRLVIPALALETGKVHIFKTAHDPRFEIDYKVPAVDVAMATAAAPTYFREHLGAVGPALIDGGLWANDPTGLAVVEAIGVLGWDRADIHVLSIGCTMSPLEAMKNGPKGRLQYATRITDLFMTAQSSGSQGTAAVLIGHDHLHRCTVVVDRKRFDIDDSEGIDALRGLGEEEARSKVSVVRQRFFATPAEPFTPYRKFTR